MDPLSQNKLQALLPDHYKLERPLTAGSFGHTYLAQNTQLEGAQRCVIKMLSLHRSEDWKVIDLFEREAKILKHLDHENIPNYVDSFTLQDEKETYFFLVQEYVSGKSLREWVEDGRHFKTAEVLKIGWQAADILSYLHGFSPPIIHRDLKPSNLMLDEDNKLWIIDFGAVRDTLLAQGKQGSTIVGTFGYMPMEQYEGRAKAASDLYALGMTLIFLITRQEPSQLPKKQLKPNFRSRANISERFSKVLDKLVEIDLNKRYQKAEEVRQEFARLQRKKPLPGERLASLNPFNKPGNTAILAVICIAALLFGLILFLGNEPEQSILAQPAAVDFEIGKAQTLPLPAPWQTKGKYSNIQQVEVAENGAFWLRGYNKVYYQKKDGLPGFFKWSSEQILATKSFQAMSLHKNSVYLLSAQEGVDQKLVYTQSPEDLWQRIDLPQGKKAAKVFFVDQKENIWVSKEKTLWMYDSKTHLWKKQYVFNGDIYAGAEDANGKIWIGTLSDLYLFTNTQARPQGNLQKGYFKKIVAGQNGIGIVSSEGFYRYNPKTMQAKRFLKKHTLTDAVPFSKGWLVSTEGDGMHFLPNPKTTTDKEKSYSWSYANGLPEDHISSLSANADTLVAMVDKEFLIYAPSQEVATAIQKIKHPAPIPSAHAYETACEIPKNSGDVFVDRSEKAPRAFFQGKLVCPYSGKFWQRGKLFYVQQDKLYIKTSKSTRSVPMPIENYLSPRSLLYDSQERIWLSLSLKGNFLFQAGKWTKLNLKSNQHFIEVKGKVYAVSERSPLKVQVYENGFKQLNPPPNMTYSSIYDVKASADQTRLILGSSSGLLVYRIAEQEWEQLNKDFVQDLVVTPQGVWATLFRKGLSYYDFEEGSTQRWTTRDGLLSNSLQKLALDYDNNLWVQDRYGRVAAYAHKDLLKNHVKIQKNKARTAGS